jgi:hypothetical protein
VQLPHFVDRHGIKIEFLAHPTAFSRVRFEGSLYSVATRIFKRRQVRYPPRQLTGLPVSIPIRAYRRRRISWGARPWRVSSRG